MYSTWHFMRVCRYQVGEKKKFPDHIGQGFMVGNKVYNMHLQIHLHLPARVATHTHKKRKEKKTTDSSFLYTALGIAV